MLFPQVARRKGIPEAVLQELWAAYRKQLLWDERFPGPGYDLPPCLDSKDAPYVALSELIEAAGILSEDRDIERLGGKRLTFTFVLSVRDYARAATYFVTFFVGGMFIGGLSIGALCQIIKGVGSLVPRLPDAVKVALLIGAAVAVLHPASRQKIRKFLQGAGAMAAGLWPEFEKMLALAAEKQEEAGTALTTTESLLRCE